MPTKPKIVILSGAGISAESGIRTFRAADGLWEEHRVEDVASPSGWRRDRELVLDFYNQRRRQLKEVAPNAAHLAIADLERDFDVTVITQNIDNLHERAGSSHIIHLHGSLIHARSTQDEKLVYEWHDDITTADKCERGSQLRPHIVWFGEDVPLLSAAAEVVSEADVVIVVGTSMQVYPAAGLVGFAPRKAAVYYVDPSPTINHELSVRPNLTVIDKPATVGMAEVVEELRRQLP